MAESQFFNTTQGTSATGCCGNLTAPSGGPVTSPNYPSNYGNNENCEWSITVPEGSIIRLTFDSFSTENGHDVLTIYDGSSDSAAELQRLTGQPSVSPVTSTSNIMFLRFTSSGDGTRRGFQFSYISSTPGQCWDPGMPSNGTRDNNDNFASGQTVSYTCVDGYQLLGTANITCQSNGTWSDATPTCKHRGISCSLGYFRCGHGRACILSWNRCDGVMNCTDGSDEEGCVCLPMPEGFQLDSRLTMLPNQLDQMTFEEIQNSSAVELLDSSYSIPGEHHLELRKFASAVIFPRCNVSEGNETACLSSPTATSADSCNGTQLAPCRSWCEEVLNEADDWIKELLPPCNLFPSSKDGCWNQYSSIKGKEVCYHGNGMNYRGTWSKTATGAVCVEWTTAEDGYYLKKYPWANLDNNYCRNPTGLNRPFCLDQDDRQQDCDVVPCDAEICWDRGPPNYGLRSPNKRVFYVGERVTYTCNEGYTLKSGYNGEVRCIEGGRWEFDKPSCSVNHWQRLREELLETYTETLPPVNVTINFKGAVDLIVELDEKKEQLVASVVIDMTWQDSRLSWDPEYYDDIDTLSVRDNEIWTPTLTLKKNYFQSKLLGADPIYKELQRDVPVGLSNDGVVEWGVETLTTTVCDAHPFLFPADIMECHVCFFLTTATNHTIKCQGGRRASGIGYNPCNSSSNATTEGEWYRKDKTFAKDNREACFAVRLERIPLFHIATTVGPCVILVVLMTITFFMPLDRGDRISFGVTILLSMVVSLVFVTEVLPVKGFLPFFASLIIVCMGLMGLFLFFTMGIIILHDREGSLPPLAQIIFLRYISKMMLLGDLTKVKGASAIEMTNYAFQGDDMAAVFGGDKVRAGQPKPPPTGLDETTGSSRLRKLTSIVKELTRAVNNQTEELTKAIRNEEVVSDYTLLAQVLDRLCLVMYIVSIAAAVPMTMYLGESSNTNLKW
ncbi:uncharacterized protein [Branchiostoma lanceolatum]|uniref:uncharacterized protein n=1 Tax=Branchiostoma lanceolatum TaxID=7740 RepID=UPI0034546DEC